MNLLMILTAQEQFQDIHKIIGKPRFQTMKDIITLELFFITNSGKKNIIIGMHPAIIVLSQEQNLAIK